ncbi:hypothetical protein BCV53_14590 [Parageobacillus thermoglucosidasius]|uniref:Uncharacterized protein n=1 Tax=Parageobacillus thermoglucosidasius TaxID=1426 RepID=A0AAN1D7H2_PARTM|nr:hypothetical protein AOT13_14565 [Parageobacillus thermoglucosidasius]ANZ31214.1 hypothetical protein BCV53_14590 [Parageobacillus thermoglucosidasius]RDE25693.1 hypothetical protein DV712_01770 [Parageobacillus thermoglucosidasius]REK58168.1 MAG: hypothetical protein C6P36_05235 [Geobacillus sp.]
MLLLMLFRFILKAMAAPSGARVWLFVFAIFFTLVYAVAYIVLFFSGCAVRQPVMRKKKLLRHEILTCPRSINELKRIFFILSKQYISL